MHKQNRNPLPIILTILSVMVIFFSVNTLHAADITLSWDKPNDSRVIGYKIYCGISGTNFKSTPVQTINSANQTSCLISNLEEGRMYDFAATSFDSDNNESAFSETVNYLIAALIDADGDGYTINEGDCNDNNAAIHPGATEICGDGIDQDCNGSDLQCAQSWYKDADKDKYSDGTSHQSVNRPASYYLASELTATSGDCNDNNAAIHPGATEICGDGIDQDCNGSDRTCSQDIDSDGDGYTKNEGDWNDNNATIFPGAIEICGDGIDQDCNGSDLECIPEEAQDITMELGEIEINHLWKSVAFNKRFTNPVVVAKPISLNGGNPAVVRIRNVNATGFQIRVQEWEYLDGGHIYETVSYMVMEAGRHVLPNGINVEAGTFKANSRKKTVTFNQTFNQIPVVISGVTTENERDAVTGRISGISSGTFNFLLQEQELYKTRHYTYETISYIAWEPSSGTVNGMSYIVDSTLKQVTHNLYNILFYPSFTNPPLFLADMQTANNGDTANVRWQNKNTAGIKVQIDEEQSKDLEVRHIAEVVGYMALSPSASPAER